MFITINKDGMKLNADVNVKNELTKECVIKDLFGILVIVSVNVINHVTGELLDYKIRECRKRLIDKLVEECSENIDGNKILYNDTLNAILLNTIPLDDYKKVCGSCTHYLLYFS